MIRSGSRGLVAGPATKEKCGRGAGCRLLRSGLQRALARQHHAASDSPATRGLADQVFIDDSSAGPVRADADALGSNSDQAILFSDHKAVGDMVTKRIVVAESYRCVRECLGALKPAISECIEVIDEVVREQLVQPVESTGVHKMAVQCDQLVDRKSLLGR